MNPSPLPDWAGRLVRAVLIIMVLAVGWLFVGFWYESPLKGKAKRFVVTLRDYSASATNGGVHVASTNTITIDQPAQVAAIEASLAHVQMHAFSGSGEGYPKYTLEVEYVTGATQTFGFTRTEWGGGSGWTPRPLLEELKRDGL